MRPSTAYVSQATGRRTVLNPRRARLSTNCLVTGGFPQPVSQLVVLSSVLPMLVPGVISGTAAQASTSVIFSSGGGVAPGDELETAFDVLSGGGRRHPSAATAPRSPVRSNALRAVRMLISFECSFILASGQRALGSP